MNAFFCWCCHQAVPADARRCGGCRAVQPDRPPAAGAGLLTAAVVGLAAAGGLALGQWSGLAAGLAAGISLARALASVREVVSLPPRRRGGGELTAGSASAACTTALAFS